MGKRAIFVLFSGALLAGCLANGEGNGRSAQGLDAGPRDARGRVDGGRRSLDPRDGGPGDATDGPDAALPEYTWVDDVQPIVEAKCSRCHSVPATEDAPFSIVTYADTQVRLLSGARVHERMGVRVVSTSSPMPPPFPSGPPTVSLTPAEKEIIRIWSVIGAPERHVESDAGAGDGDAGGRRDASPDGASPDAGAGDATAPDAAPLDGGTPDSGLRDPLLGMGPVTSLATGYQFLEGPAWDATAGVLYFSDVAGNDIYRLSATSSVTLLRSGSNGATGLAIDASGLLLAAEQQARRVTRTLQNGTIATVSGEYMGNLLNSPNDVLVRPSDGLVYFTDPPFGLGTRTRELAFNGLFRLSLAGGGAVVEWEALPTEGLNGLGISPDEGTLYVSDYSNDVLYALDVAASGALSNRRALVARTPNQPDGIAVDDAGNIFVATSNGVTVYAPNGTLFGDIELPQVPGAATSCAFGGANRRTLYITSRTTLYGVPMSIPGGS